MTNRKFAVIGHPIEHSMSPFLNERLFDLYGAPAAYETMDIAPAPWRALCRSYGCWTALM